MGFPIGGDARIDDFTAQQALPTYEGFAVCRISRVL
jgi:hypothetical protein